MIFRAQFFRLGKPAERVTFGDRRAVDAVVTALLWRDIFKADENYLLSEVADKFPPEKQITLELES